MYPELLNEIAYLQTDSRLYTQTPIAQKTVTSVISLPIWPELDDQSVQTVIEAVSNALSALPHQSPISEQGINS